MRKTHLTVDVMSSPLLFLRTKLRPKKSTRYQASVRIPSPAIPHSPKDVQKRMKTRRAIPKLVKNALNRCVIWLRTHGVTGNLSEEEFSILRSGLLNLCCVSVAPELLSPETVTEEYTRFFRNRSITSRARFLGQYILYFASKMGRCLTTQQTAVFIHHLTDSLRLRLTKPYASASFVPSSTQSWPVRKKGSGEKEESLLGSLTVRKLVSDEIGEEEKDSDDKIEKSGVRQKRKRKRRKQTHVEDHLVNEDENVMYRLLEYMASRHNMNLWDVEENLYSTIGAEASDLEESRREELYSPEHVDGVHMSDEIDEDSEVKQNENWEENECYDNIEGVEEGDNGDDVDSGVDLGKEETDNGDSRNEGVGEKNVSNDVVSIPALQFPVNDEEMSAVREATENTALISAMLTARQHRRMSESRKSEQLFTCPGEGRTSLAWKKVFQKENLDWLKKLSLKKFSRTRRVVTSGFDDHEEEQTKSDEQDKHVSRNASQPMKQHVHSVNLISDAIELKRVRNELTSRLARSGRLSAREFHEGSKTLRPSSTMTVSTRYGRSVSAAKGTSRRPWSARPGKTRPSSDVGVLHSSRSGHAVQHVPRAEQREVIRQNAGYSQRPRPMTARPSYSRKDGVTGTYERLNIPSVTHEFREILRTRVASGRSGRKYSVRPLSAKL